MRLTAEEFERAASGLRWSPRTLGAVRALLVDGKTHKDVAAQAEMKRQQVHVLEKRFTERMRALEAVKVSPDEYLASLKPDRAREIDVFLPALRKLRRRGLSTQHLVDYLAQNDFKIGQRDLENALGGNAQQLKTRKKQNANSNAGKSKGRSR